MKSKSYFNGLGATRKPQKKTKSRKQEGKGEASESGKGKHGKGKKNFTYVDSIDEQVKILRRFKNIAGKTIPVSRLLTFIKSLQKAIHERRIRKSDHYASEIDSAQKIAIQAYQRTTGKNVEMKVPSALFERIAEIAKSEKVRPSVAFLKRFVGLVGKPYHEKSKQIHKLYESLIFMRKRGIIPDNDPYIGKLKSSAIALQKAIENNKRITIPTATLSGLNGIIADETAAGFL